MAPLVEFIISVAVVIVRVAVFASIAIGVRESQLPPDEMALWCRCLRSSPFKLLAARALAHSSVCFFRLQAASMLVGVLKSA